MGQRQQGVGGGGSFSLALYLFQPFMLPCTGLRAFCEIVFNLCNKTGNKAVFLVSGAGSVLWFCGTEEDRSVQGS